MIEVLVLVSLLLGGVVVAGLVVIALILKLALWTVLLPFRLLFLLLIVPLAIVKFAFRLIAALVLLPIAAMVAVFGAGGLLLAGLLFVFLPLIPLLFLGWLVWVAARSLPRSNVPAVS